MSTAWKTLSDKLKSKAFSTLAKRIEELAQSEYYKELNDKLAELTNRVRERKTVFSFRSSKLLSLSFFCN